ncbi:hypothetical protein [Lichenicoccus sp.]|uniref:hypothetical protein n=1 Tax=Lichenicoccus sp. TaxID=2781899 RepID=UPI003D11ECD1
MAQDIRRDQTEVAGGLRHSNLSGTSSTGATPTPPLPNDQSARASDDLLLQENIEVLARIVASEARGENETSQKTVAWTAVNRMKKHSFTQVSSVLAHGNYSHSSMSTLTSLQLADDILSGCALDISQGATHFYSPRAMPKRGDRPSSNVDVLGGLESVPGVVGRNGQPVENYRPGWAKNVSPIRIPGIQDKDFKFFRL